VGDLVVPVAAANLVQADPVAAVEELSGPVAQAAVIVVADLAFLAVAAIGREDRAMGIGRADQETTTAIAPVDLATEIVRAVRAVLAMEIALVVLVTVIDRADLATTTIALEGRAVRVIGRTAQDRVEAVSSGDLVIDRVVLAIGPTGRTDLTIGRGAIRIGTSRRTGGAIAGRT
jgi:hypothetical protein